MNKALEEKNTNRLENILKSLAQEVTPDATFKHSARIRLLNRITERQQAFLRSSHTFTRPFQFALAAVLLFLAGSVGTIFAAQSSLPSDSLYPVKTASEQALLAIVPDSLKGQVALMIADRRANEVKSLSDQGKQDQIPNAVLNYEQSINKVETIDHISQEILNQHIATHQQVLNKVLQQVPDQAKPAIEHAMNASSNASSSGVQNQPGNHNQNRNNNPSILNRFKH